MSNGARKGRADNLSIGCGCALAAIPAIIGLAILAYLLTSSP